MQVDSRKVECATRNVAQNYVRDATVYKMYYRSPDIERGDTVFFFCTLFHLKPLLRNEIRETLVFRGQDSGFSGQ